MIPTGAYIAPLALLCLTACAAPSGGDQTVSSADTGGAVKYLGVETQLLDGDLVNFKVSMQGAETADDVARYAECAAAEYTLIRGYGFARHVRTNVSEAGGIWNADAVYTISPALPDGIKKIDAEVVAADCAENGIPRV